MYFDTYFDYVFKINHVCYIFKLNIMFYIYRYDSHLLLTDLCRLEQNVYVTPKSMEKYSAISTNRFRFIDSMNHLPCGLEKLANLITDPSPIELEKYVDEFYPSSGIF